MISNYPDQPALIRSDSVGVNFAISKIQRSFGERLSWIQKSFGRCTIFSEKTNQTENRRSRERERIFPITYSDNAEPYDLMPNDNLYGYCFFIVNDAGEFNNYNFASSQHFMTRNVSVVFWLNVKKNFPNQTEINETLIISVLQVLKSHPEFVMDEVKESYKKVFEEFTIDENMRQYMKYPYSAFRIEGKITYPMLAENCQ